MTALGGNSAPENPNNLVSPCGILNVNLDAVAQNYTRLTEIAAPAACGAVVKANAYGLGADRIAPALAAAGCNDFFVATVEEAITLRRRLASSAIYVFNGLCLADADLVAEHRLIPVLNDLGQLEAWRQYAQTKQSALPAALHLDTGMNRLGFSPTEWRRLLQRRDLLQGIELALVMSHLACSEQPENPMNPRQLQEFSEGIRHFPDTPASLANSGGIFLGSGYHFQMVRAGLALWGVNRAPKHPHKMEEVLQLQGKILQLREVDSPATVGYGATHKIHKPSVIATVGIGYADGYPVSMSNRGYAYIGGQSVPVVGQISMDSLTLDVTAIAVDQCPPESYVELLGPHISVTEFADLAQTTPYEILTGFGARLRRIYQGTAEI